MAHMRSLCVLTMVCTIRKNGWVDSKESGGFAWLN